MRSKQPANELAALTAQLETLTKDPKSQFRAIRALADEAPRDACVAACCVPDRSEHTFATIPDPATP